MPFSTRRVAPAAVLPLLTALLLLAAVVACAQPAPPSDATDPSPTDAGASSATSTSTTPADGGAPSTPEAGGGSGSGSDVALATAQPSAPSPGEAEAEATATPMAGVRAEMNIPEIAGIDAWLNTDEALSIAELTAEGKVVLVDFWTYTCVNCIRTLPYLRDWWAQYEDDGLVILGIHAPEFEFEKDYQNVADAIAAYDIGWPVAQDNLMATWRNFENRYWPAKYLFNSRGEQIYSHFGEGAYGETERRIRNALVEAGADLSDDPLNLPEDQARDQAFQAAGNLLGRAPITPELYAGWHRNFLTARAGRPPYVAQQEYFDAILNQKNRTEDTTGIMDVAAPQDIQPHRLYFHGQWSVEPERTRHARVTESLEDYIALNYAAKSVNVVLTSDSGEPYRVIVTVDGAMLTPANAGADVQWDDNGYSYVLVDEPRMYGLVDNPKYLAESILLMRSNSDDFGIFAFTFGIYAEGP